jgi:hypothetical protein
MPFRWATRVVRLALVVRNRRASGRLAHPAGPLFYQPKDSAPFHSIESVDNLISIEDHNEPVHRTRSILWASPRMRLAPSEADDNLARLKKGTGMACAPARLGSLKRSELRLGRPLAVAAHSHSLHSFENPSSDKGKLFPNFLAFKTFFVNT